MFLAWSIPAAFLIGSIPFGLLIARSRGVDIRKHGSGNIGATNVGRVLGKKLGFFCFACDLLKGLLPTLGAGLYLGRAGHWSVEPGVAWQWLAVMVSPVLGHMFCPWIGFKGGKGVATGLGALLGVFPALTIPGVGAAVVWLMMLRVWRYVGMSSVVASASLPVWVAAEFAVAGSAGWIGAGTAWMDVVRLALPFFALTLALAALVIVKHRANIARTLAGTEPRVKWMGGGPRDGSPPPPPAPGP